MTTTVKHDQATNSDEYLLHWAHNTVTLLKFDACFKRYAPQ